MGRLNIPDSSRIYLDTSVAIYSIEKLPNYFSLLEPMWLKFPTGDREIISSELTLMECLVFPIKMNDSILINA
jgi:hypothetical protein